MSLKLKKILKRKVVFFPAIFLILLLLSLFVWIRLTMAATATWTNGGGDGLSTNISLDSTDTNGGNNGACWVFSSTTVTDFIKMKGNVTIKGNAIIKK